MLNKRFENNNKPALKLNQTQLSEILIVKNKISSKDYKFADCNCPICNESKEFTYLSEKDRYGFYYPLQICNSCGLVMANPRLQEENYEDFYRSGHQKKIYVGEDRPGVRYFQIQYNKGKRIFDYVTKNIDTQKKLKVLEVGCGAGGILKVFEENGHQIKGIDLNEEYIRFGKNDFNLNLLNQNLFDIQDEKYDLIIYSHVLEHILDPSSHLSFIKDLLTESGKIYIEVPGIKKSYEFYGDFMKYIQNAHVFNFSLTTLKNLMHLNGFVNQGEENELIQSLWMRNDNSEFVIQNDYEDCLAYLGRNEKLWNRIMYRNIYRLRRLKTIVRKVAIQVIKR